MQLFRCQNNETTYLLGDNTVKSTVKIGLNFNNISKPEYKILKYFHNKYDFCVNVHRNNFSSQSVKSEESRDGRSFITFCWWHWRCYPGRRRTRCGPSMGCVSTSSRLWSGENSRHLCYWMAHQKPAKINIT